MNADSFAAVVTGGTRGIGRAISLRLARWSGATIVVNYLQNEKAAAEACRLIEAQGARCVTVRANLCLLDEIDRLADAVKSETDHVDAFIHCAALTAFKPLIDVKPNQWDLTMNLNTRGFLRCVQMLLPIMRNPASIVALSSLGSTRVTPNYGAMGPTKAALEAVVRYLAAELAPRGIRVNAVSAGLIDTDSIRRFPDPEGMIASAVARTPIGKIGSPDDVADVVQFLIGAEARLICGQTIVADGGISLY